MRSHRASRTSTPCLGSSAATQPLLKKALELKLNHARAVREMAMLLRMKNNLDAMRPYMEAALKNDSLDLDMCRLYLDHHTAVATAARHTSNPSR